MDRCSFIRMVRERVLRLDGATGTELAKQGMPPGVCPEKWVTENPQALCAVQGAYVKAGSNIVRSWYGLRDFWKGPNEFDFSSLDFRIDVSGITRTFLHGRERFTQ